MINKAFKYRFYPTKEQEQLLAKTFGCVRFVYNNILKWRTDTYYSEQVSVDYCAASKRLTTIKKLPEYEWLNEVSAVALQQSLRHQQAAFKNFFNKIAGYPTFKKKDDKQSASFVKGAFKYRNGDIFIAKSPEPLNIKWSRELPCEPNSITISKDCAGRYYVSCLCEVESEILPTTTNQTGVDVGIKHLFVTDKGHKEVNQRNTAKYAKKLAKYQKRLARKKLGSSNRNKAKLKVARVHAKISDCRLDNLHKLSRKLVNESQVICVESLKVKNMIRNPKLSKHIADASWGEFTRQLEYKSAWAGRQFVKIDTFFPSSKRCFDCGHIVESLPLDVREWACPVCHAEHDRDINAAKNILAAGLAVSACGENVSLA